MRNPLKNQKGAAVIEFTIGLIVLCMLLAFLVDIIMINYKRIMVSRLNQSIVRAVRTQGGIASSMPASFSGSSSSYSTSAQLTTKVNTLKTQLKLTAMSVKISGTTVNGGTCSATLSSGFNCQYQYMSPVTIETTFSMPWTYTFMGGESQHQQTIKSSVVSEYKNIGAGEKWEVLK